MKLAKVKVQYTCGLTLVDRVVLDLETGDVHTPPRLAKLMSHMVDVESPPVFCVEYSGRVFPVHSRDDDGAAYRITLPRGGVSNVPNVFHAVFFPTKDQLQQSGRLLHTLSAAAFVSAAATLHSMQNGDWTALASASLQGGAAVLLWFMGLLCMKGD